MALRKCIDISVVSAYVQNDIKKRKKSYLSIWSRCQTGPFLNTSARIIKNFLALYYFTQHAAITSFVVLLESSNWQGDDLDASHLFILSCRDAKVLSFRLWQGCLFSREPKPLKWNLAVGCDSFEMPASSSGAEGVQLTHIHTGLVKAHRRHQIEGMMRNKQWSSRLGQFCGM